MTKRYRILGAMLALGEFTVRDVARQTQIHENTVRTVLNRDCSDCIQRVDMEPTGRRGGQPVRYRLSEEAREKLQGMLTNLFAELGRAGQAVTDPAAVAEEMAPFLRDAEAQILSDFPRCGSREERTRLLALARVTSQGKREDLEALRTGGAPPYLLGWLRTHVETLEGLVALGEAELREGDEAAREIERLRGRLKRFVPRLQAVGEDDLARAVASRLGDGMDTHAQQGTDPGHSLDRHIQHDVQQLFVELERGQKRLRREVQALSSRLERLDDQVKAQDRWEDGELSQHQAPDMISINLRDGLLMDNMKS